MYTGGRLTLKSQVSSPEERLSALIPIVGVVANMPTETCDADADAATGGFGHLRAHDNAYHACKFDRGKDAGGASGRVLGCWRRGLAISMTCHLPPRVDLIFSNQTNHVVFPVSAYLMFVRSTGFPKSPKLVSLNRSTDQASL